MRYLKSYKLFESRIQDLEDDVHDILIELEDEGLQIEMSRISKDVEDDMRRGQGTSVLRTDVFLEVRILKPWNSPDREMPNLPSAALARRLLQNHGFLWGGKYPLLRQELQGNLFFWFEIKDAIIRLTEWYYSQSIHKPIDKKDKQFKEDSPLRFFNSGIEFGVGWSKEEDFPLDDLISFTSLRIEIKL